MKSIKCDTTVTVTSPRKRLTITKLGLSFSILIIFLTSYFSYDKKFGGSYLPLQLFNKNELDNPDTRVPIEILKDNYLYALESENLASNWTEKYCSEPMLAGTNYDMVKWAASKFEEYNFDVEIDDYYVYLSFPNNHSLSLFEEHKKKNTTTMELIYNAPLKEDILDEEGGDANNLVPTFLGYAASGLVESEYIFANYGTMSDFQKLVDNKIDIKGKVFIIRYGKIFRGLKVKFAQDFGAKGVILYSDPLDDLDVTNENGYKSYPLGPARQSSSVQRGSVQFLSIFPGDPTTPGYGSKKPNIPRSDPYYTTPRIPVLPISYKEITPILQRLNGHGSNLFEIDNSKNKGIKDFSYQIGPNPSLKLELFNDQAFNITPIWNIYAKIKGEIEDEVIIIGNHHDSWIKGGAGDPHSGSSVLMEVARSIDYLRKSTGWIPRRTIILASWDGEEYGLLGSTEFGEYFANHLKAKVVAYFNLDVACVGKVLHLGSSPLLFDILKNTAGELEYPITSKNQTLLEHFEESLKNGGGGGVIKDLGSGSDYTVFLDHLGIPSADLGFTSYNNQIYKDEISPIYHYHSNYDSFYWMSNFGDPGFVYHNLMAKYLGLLIIETSERKLIPFKLQDYSIRLNSYFKDSLSLIPKHWLNESISDLNDTISFLNSDCNVTKSSHHTKKTYLFQLIKEVKEQLCKLEKNSIKFDINNAVLKLKYENEYNDLNYYQRLKLIFNIKFNNFVLKFYERTFLFEEGLKNRPWFKHIVYASGRYTGYAGQTLPGLKESIEDASLEDTVKWLHVILKTIKRLNLKIKFCY
ncbi:hypothetical protein B5S32_g1904 [[Candida] boidinii]|nr:hypothetical protein B5S32_g1904 [[Candida] boidinii]